MLNEHNSNRLNVQLNRRQVESALKAGDAFTVQSLTTEYELN